MIKIYLFSTLVLLSLALYGCDWWLESNNYTWKGILSAWPFWLLFSVSGFALGGFLLGLLAQYSFQRDSLELEKSLNEKYKTYEKSVHDKFIQREKDIRKQIAQIESDKSDAFIAMEEANEIREDAERIRTESLETVNKLQKSNFNATKTVERLKKKIART